jgi:hypothetical protein
MKACNPREHFRRLIGNTTHIKAIHLVVND